MYQIAICDDERPFLNALNQMTADILTQMGAVFRVDCYTTSAALLHKIRDENMAYQLLLLDIMMDEPDGLALAAAVRALDEDVSIVFTTSSKKHALQGYQVRPLHYLLKPVDPAELQKILEYDYRRRTDSQYLTINSGGVLRRVPVGDIYYLEIAGRKVAIHTAGETLHMVARLAELENSLPRGRFVRCHQSFLVNIARVREITRSEALLTDGRCVPISRSNLPRVQQAFLRSMSSL